MQNLPLTRREFIRGAGGLGFLAFSGVAPAFLARSAMAQTPAPERDRSILVIVQLAGGNDGLNTVIPYTDDRYYNLRPTLGLKNNLLELNDNLALHPACQPLHELYGEGKLSIVQNVGYPNPNRSPHPHPHPRRCTAPSAASSPHSPKTCYTGCAHLPN